MELDLLFLYGACGHMSIWGSIVSFLDFPLGTARKRSIFK